MQTEQPKIIFFGTSEFALPALEALVREGYSVVAVVTNPDEPAGRKQEITPPPVKQLVAKSKWQMEILQPHDLKTVGPALSAMKPDLFIVASYGKIIPANILEIPKHGAINIHPSLLPRWRGPSPIQYTILHGDKETGVTIIKIDELMDHGPVVANEKLEIKDQKVTYKILHDELAQKGAALLITSLPGYLDGEIIPVPQDDAKATFSKILKKDSGRVDWKKPVEEIERMVRAFGTRPGTWTLWPTETKILRVKIEKALANSEEPRGGSPGYVWHSGGSLLVKTGKGSLEIKKMTLEGKSSLSASEITRGYPKIIGSTLI